MNYDTFLKFLQSIITMVDENDPESVKNGKTILENLRVLIWSSGKANGQVMRMIGGAVENYENLIRFKDDFAGAPGDIMRNRAKRDRLAMAIYPRC